MEPRDTRHWKIIAYNLSRYLHLHGFVDDRASAAKLGMSIENFQMCMQGDRDFTPDELNRIEIWIQKTHPEFKIADLYKLPEDAVKPSATILEFPKR